MNGTGKGTFVSIREAQRIMGFSQSTLRKMADEGLIHVIKTPGGHRKFDVSSYTCKQLECKEDKVSICYARVSSKGQRDDLQRQILYLKERFPNHQIIKDIGSGLNFKRKGLRQILDLAHKGEIKELVVAHKDRLCRFGFELIEYILSTYSNAPILVLNNVSLSPEQELSKDILQILTVFGARVNGLRKYKHTIKNDKSLSGSTAEADA